MHIDITFKNMDASDALKDYATKRLARIGKYIDRPTEAHVVLSVAKIRHQADVTLNADGVMINAVDINDDMYAAIDMVMDKLERQVKKHKEKVQDKKGQARAYQMSTISPEGPGSQPQVVRESDYFVKPMSVEEAVLQIGMDDKEFIVFQNTDSNQINLMYKRPDGDLGLIEPMV